MAKFVTKIEAVAQCLDIIRRAPIHPNFAGYLSLKLESIRQGRTTKLLGTYKEFFDTFLRVPGAPPNKPYIMPFSGGTKSDATIWYNSNVAGSYAQSSIRDGSPFDQVVIIEGKGKATLYSLRDKHWEIAYEELASKNKIPVVPLAVLLYRDFAVEVDTPTTRDLVDIFRYEFGYTREASSQADTEFHYLFTDNSDSEPHKDWFEEFNGDNKETA